MNEVFSRLKIIYKSKTFSEFIDNVPQSYIEFMAFFPLLMFTVLPLWQLIHNFIQPDGYGVTFDTKAMGVLLCASTFGIIAVILNVAKSIRSSGRPTLKSLVSSNIPMVFFLFLIIMMIASTAVNGFTASAVYGDPYRREGLFSYMGYFAVYFLTATIISENRLRKALMYSLISASLPLSVLALIDKLVVFIPAFEMSSGLSGVFSHFNHYGYYLTIVVLVSSVLFVKEQNAGLRVLSMASFVINNTALIVNNTFGCYLACFTALIFGIVIISIAEGKLNKLSVAMLAIFIAITFLMSFRFESVLTNVIALFKDIESVSVNPEEAEHAGTGRWSLWMHTLQYISERPFLGFGVEGISARLMKETGAICDRPHNEILQYAVFFGIPAGLAYVGGVFSVYLNGLKNRLGLDIFALVALTAAFGYLVSSMFGNTAYYTAPFLFIMLGLGFVRKKSEIKS